MTAFIHRFAKLAIPGCKTPSAATFTKTDSGLQEGSDQDLHTISMATFTKTASMEQPDQDPTTWGPRAIPR